jgi:type IV fimbrial biogenesis protein FimT
VLSIFSRPYADRSVPADRQHRKSQPATFGFSLFEVLVVIAISLVLLCIAAPSLQGFIESRRFQALANQVAVDIELARAQAIGHNRAVHIGFAQVHSGSCYVLYSGNKGDCTCTPDGEPQCRAGLQQHIKTVSQPTQNPIHLSANVGTMSINPLHGTVTPTGTLTLISGSGKKIQQIVNIMGRTRTCAEQVPGYPPC